MKALLTNLFEAWEDRFEGPDDQEIISRRRQRAEALARQLLPNGTNDRIDMELDDFFREAFTEFDPQDLHRLFKHVFGNLNPEVLALADYFARYIDKDLIVALLRHEGPVTSKTFARVWDSQLDKYGFRAGD